MASNEEPWVALDDGTVHVWNLANKEWTKLPLTPFVTELGVGAASAYFLSNEEVTGGFAIYKYDTL